MMKIFLIGFMGTGKTHWGRLLSRKMGLPFFDLDEQIVNSAGKSINEIFAEKGEEQFRLLEKETLHIIAESHESFIMACGGGTPCFFNNIVYMKEMGTVVWINTSAQTIFERLLKEKDHRPLLRDLSDDQLKNFIAKKIADRRIYYQQAQVTIEEESIDIDKFVDTLFHA
ncbi:shikimate kinase [Terrimonas rubra]|uniref:Shikimate kinase n=1 Tax=Terrimonas rubra TaxID=1035890 RepID=A0ABW6A7U9_9BACT